MEGELTVMRAPSTARRRTARVECVLAPRDDSARWARELTTAFLAQCGGASPACDEDLLGDATLVVSELVTNATRHGRGRCRLGLRGDARRLTVEVHDHSPHRPRRGALTESAESGRGIAIVRLLAHRYTVTGHPRGGKTVQAVLAAG